MQFPPLPRKSHIFIMWLLIDFLTHLQMVSTAPPFKRRGKSKGRWNSLLGYPQDPGIRYYMIEPCHWCCPTCLFVFFLSIDWGRDVMADLPSIFVWLINGVASKGSHFQKYFISTSTLVSFKYIWLSVIEINWISPFCLFKASTSIWVKGHSKWIGILQENAKLRVL